MHSQVHFYFIVSFSLLSTNTFTAVFVDEINTGPHTLSYHTHYPTRSAAAQREASGYRNYN